MNLNRHQLLELLVSSINANEWRAIITDRDKPFFLRLFRDDERGPDVCIYIWNCTHGGGTARAEDEYRIQFTGVVPTNRTDAITLLLGWHSGYEVFAAWDIRRHSGQDSNSPSAQIREDVLREAHSRQFAVGTRGNGEIVVAFRPEFFVDYTVNSTALHQGLEANDSYAVLQKGDEATDEDVADIENVERRRIVSTIVRRFRAADFRKRVLGAYGHRCVMCGVQLKLVEAAHIIPVASDESSDATANGLALCKLHHAAYDRNLVSFDEDLKIEVSAFESAKLVACDRGGGIDRFIESLRPVLLLPNDKRDLPTPKTVEISKRVRDWVA